MARTAAVRAASARVSTGPATRPGVPLPRWRVLLALAGLQAGAAFAQDAEVAKVIEECLRIEDSQPVLALALVETLAAQLPDLEPAQQAELVGCRGWSKAMLEQREGARVDAHLLRRIVDDLPRGPERVRLLRRAGTILHRTNDRVGAVDFYADAVVEAENEGMEAARIPLLVNLGVLHSEFEEHEHAQRNYEKALELMQRLQDFRYEAPVRFNLALNLRGQHRYAEALPHLQRTMELLRESPGVSQAQAVSVRTALASVLQAVGDSEEAMRLIDEVRPRLAPDDAISRLHLILFDATQLANQGRTQEALDLLAPIDPDGLTYLHRRDLMEKRGLLLEDLGRYQEALDVVRQAARMREEHLLQRNHERLAELEAHLRNREQQQQLERLRADAALQEQRLAESTRLQWLVAGIAALLIAGGLITLALQRRMNRQLDHAARTDPLTGLANRRDLVERLQALPPQRLALSLVDVDLFKQINDSHGHDVGDQVLVAFAQRLRAHAEAHGALVGRWGGEEFLLAQPCLDVASATRAAEALRSALSQPVETRVGMLGVHASIGVANLPLPGDVGADAWQHSLQLADAAMYLAKHAGRDAWVAYWIEQQLPGWPPARLARESQRARELGLITPLGSRDLA